MAASSKSFSSTINAFESSFPPLPSRPLQLDPSNPPPPLDPSTSANPSLLNPGGSSSHLIPANQELIRSDLSIKVNPGASTSNQRSDPSTSQNPSSSIDKSFNPSAEKRDYASLFNSLPRNAGVFVPQHFDIPRDAPPKTLPDQVKQSGMNYWSNYLVGFFLDGTLNYLAVANYLRRYWKLKGDVDIKFDGRFYYFKFSTDFDKDRILNADPIFIRGRMFILTKWDPMIGNAQSQIRKVPVWIHFYRIPTILWTLIGINWLVCHIGRLICFDSSTERMNRFRYAKALVEISPDFELPNSIPVPALGESCPPVILTYDWKPKICTFCKNFGHETLSCELNINNKEENGHRNDTRRGDRQPDANAQSGKHKQNSQTYANQNFWKPVNSKKKNFWRKKDSEINPVDVSATDRANGSINPFESLAAENNGDDHTVIINENVESTMNQNTDKNGEVQTDIVNENVEVYMNQNTEDQQDIGSDKSNDIQLTDHTNKVAEVGNFNSSTISSPFLASSGDSSSGNTSSSCLSALASTSNCTSTSSLASSPYANLKPPNHIALPPPVTGYGLTFPQVKTSMASLSSAVPISAIPSFNSKGKKLKGKFWADDDLDEGHDYNLDDILPAGSKVLSQKRHTRRNPSPLNDPFFT